MRSGHGIGQRLWRAFLVQASIISLAALLGLVAARFILGDVLIRQAMEDEAGHFWSRRHENPGFPAPNTHNLTGYFLPGGRGDAPADLEGLAPGFHELDRAGSDYFLVYVTDQGRDRLLLVFDGQHVGELTIVFGLLPLAGVLIVLYLSSWLAYHFATRAVSPVIQLAHRLESLDPGATDLSRLIRDSLPPDSDQEVHTLGEALVRLSGRIEEFIVRERNFTRDASHELRSPITVIKLAADVQLADALLPEKARAAFARIKRSAADMEEMMEALLLLARESEHGLTLEPVCVNDVVHEELERAQPLLAGKHITLEVEEGGRLYTTASDKVLSVLIGNLIRNAFIYTDSGSVRVRISGTALTIEDSGAGIPEEKMQQLFTPFARGTNRRGGHGVGLTIVKMLSDRFHWPLEIDSRLNVGTTVTVTFAAAAT